MSEPRTLSVPELRSAFRGPVIGPGDPDYDEVRQIFPGDVDRRPAVVIRPVDAQEVAQVIALARETGLPLAVRSGGHSEFGAVDGGIVLDLRELKNLEIDTEGKTAWAGSGLTAAEYTVAVGEHGLATGFGDTGSVGIGGITLNGGIGFLVRKLGMTVDSLLAAEIVTADGQVLTVDAASHPDLFWAIRGGGGNFGVVTKFHFRLHEVPEFVGGMLMLPATPEIVTRAVAIAAEAPEELSAILNVMTAPPMPFVPPEHHGKIVLMALVGYAGPAEEGARVLAPLRALAEPIADFVKPMTYAEMFPPEDQSYRPTAAGNTMFVDTVDTKTAETVFEYLEKVDAPLRVAQLRPLGGAMARVPADATAFGHRASKVMVNTAAFYTSPEDKLAKLEWVADFQEALRQSDDGAYVGFISRDARDAYPDATWERLAEVKRHYDPENLFRLNWNIPPAS